MLLLPAILPLFCLSTIGIILLRLFGSRRPHASAPRRLPGPKGLPWLGVVTKLPRLGPWFTFKKWADQYGPIFETTLLGQRVLFVNTHEAARKLFVNKSRIYSGRPSIDALHDSQSKLGTGAYLPLMSTNQLWSSQKKAWILLWNNCKASGAAANAYEIESANYILELAQLAARQQPTTDWFYATEIMTARSAGRLIYGDPSLAPRIKQETHLWLKHISPGSFLPNLAWPLRYLPTVLSPWKRDERHRHATQQLFFQSCLAQVTRQLDKGTAPPSFARDYLESEATSTNLKSNPNFLVPDKTHAAALLGMAATFNNLTIAQPLVSLTRCLAAYPEHFEPVHREISEHVPSTRLPIPSDLPHLPYMRALLAETCRFRPPIPTNIPHELEADDFIDGVFFPAGTTVFAPSYTSSRDPTLFPNPAAFDPTRWLRPDSPVYRTPLTKYPNLTAHSSLFGHGQRYCIGAEPTEMQVMLAAARLLWAFTWRLSAAGECEVQDVAPGEERAGMRYPRDGEREGMVVSKTGACEIVLELREGVDVEGVVGAWLRATDDLCAGRD